MNRSLACIALVPILYACSESTSAQVTPGAKDECEATSSNLEYSECWQRLAAESRSRTDAAFLRAQRVSRNSDARESGDATGDQALVLSNGINDAQAKWTAFADRQCQLEGAVARGGTGTRALVAKCQVRLNFERTRELDRVASSIEAY